MLAPGSMDRRSFLGRGSAMAAGLSSWASHARSASAGPAGNAVAPATVPPTESLQGLSTYQLGPQLWVRWNNRLAACYRAHRSQKFPYLFPLAGPASGLSLTSESSLPYPHHRSNYFACDRVLGGNYWQEGLEKGQILSVGPRWGAVTPTSVEILDACEWRVGENPAVMKDRRMLRLSFASPRLRFVDWEIEWTALVDLAIPKTNHSLFAIRGADDIVPAGGGTLVNAEAATGEKGTFGKASAWCAFHGDRPGGVHEGIALFDHPGNPWSPCPWFTRDYGFLSPTPLDFRTEPLPFKAGQRFRLRYRLVLFAGTPSEADLPALHRAWAA